MLATHRCCRRLGCWQRCRGWMSRLGGPARPSAGPLCVGGQSVWVLGPLGQAPAGEQGDQGPSQVPSGRRLAAPLATQPRRCATADAKLALPRWVPNVTCTRPNVGAVTASTAARARNSDGVADLVAEKAAETKGRILATKSLPAPRAAGSQGLSVASAGSSPGEGAWWLGSQPHRGRPPAFWCPGSCWSLLGGAGRGCTWVLPAQARASLVADLRQSTLLDFVYELRCSTNYRSVDEYAIEVDDTFVAPRPRGSRTTR